MRKFKIIFTLFVCGAMISTYLISRSSNGKEFTLTLANVEALASGEDGGTMVWYNAYKGKAYSYGSLVRVKDAGGVCKMQYTENPTRDGECWQSY